MVKKEINGSWSYRFYSNGKDYRKKGFATKKEALESENKKRTEIKGFVENTNNLTALYEMYINKRKNRVKLPTLKKDEMILNKYVLSQFKTASQVNTFTINKWKNDIINLGFKEEYTNQIIKTCSSFLSYAKNYTFIDPHALDELDSVKLYEIKEEMNIWSVEEFNKFISVIDDSYFKLLFETLFWSGLRISELKALTKTDIKDNSLYINKRLDSKYTKSFTTPKTSNSFRKVLMPEWIINNLLNIPNDLLFPTSETHIRRKLNEYIKASQVKPIRIHDFRHSHASYLFSKGVNIKAISTRLGHSSISITLDVYVHLLQDNQTEIIDLIEKEKRV